MSKHFLHLIHMVALFFATSAIASTPHYAIIIDAGSSGSRLHLYQYEQTDKLPVVEDIFSEKSKPGLASFADHPEKVGESLQGMLDHAADLLQKKQVKQENVSLSILATAGMRLLPEEKATKIYKQVNDFIRSHYAFQLSHIGTISGTMEGVYGWLNVNYLLHNFDDQGKQTSGTLDMGGASTEITFASNSSYNLPDEVPVRINNKTYFVFSKSFLGLGQDQARLDIEKSQQAGTCYPINYDLPNQKKGNFNFASCQLLYKNVLGSFEVTKQLPSLAKTKFIAYSGFYYTGHFFETEKSMDQASVEKKIQQTCSDDWEKFLAAHSDTPAQYAATYCANGAYITELLYNTYQLQGSQIELADKIDGKDIDWPMGALLYQLAEAV